MPARANMKHVVSIPWSDEERTLLRQLWANGLGPVLIGRLMGRSKYSVTKQTQTLKLPPHQLPPGLVPPPGRVVLARAQPKPLAPGARTLPPLPSELQGT